LCYEAGLRLWQGAYSGSDGLNSHRIAVLPFVSMSPDPNDEYFADGLTEELIGRLCQIGELEAIARTSVMFFKNKQVKAADIGKDLMAGSLVEGSVRKAGNLIRVTAQLIDMNTEGHLWSSRYDRNLESIFELQSDIAEQIAAALKIGLLPREKQVIQKVGTKDTEAHEFYLKGLAHSFHATEQDYMTAIGYFERAVRRDPSFALAYAAMAKQYGWRGFFQMMASAEVVEKEESLARKAIELDDSLAEAHSALADALFFKFDFAGALENRLALELNPNSAEAHAGAGSHYYLLGEFDRAIRESKRALDLDPLSTVRMALLATILLYRGDLEHAEELFRRAIEREPGNSFAVGNMGLCHVLERRFDLGIGEIMKGIQMSSESDVGKKSDLIYALTEGERLSRLERSSPS
jgi:adenylate cyclase